MKVLFIIPLLLVLYSCNPIQARNDKVLKEKADTIVAVQVVPEEILGSQYLQKEYFVMYKNDTSSFSCVITESKISGKISMLYKYTPYEKIATSYSSNDTAEVAEYEPVVKFNHKSTYNNQITELKLILKCASKDFDLSKLSDVSLMMSSINGLSQHILEKYVIRFGKINYPSDHNVGTLIENSFFKTDLNNLLSSYSVIIKRSFVGDGLIDYRPRDSKAGSKAVLDGMVIFSLVPISR
jgi:hypothetical protein